LSYGGSSLLSNYVLLAMLVKISDSARAPAPVKRKVAVPLTETTTEFVPRPEGLLASARKRRLPRLRRSGQVWQPPQTTPDATAPADGGEQQ
jgi:hypothetical protein